MLGCFCFFFNGLLLNAEISGKGQSYQTPVSLGELNVQITFIHAVGAARLQDWDEEGNRKHKKGNWMKDVERNKSNLYLLLFCLL